MSWEDELQRDIHTMLSYRGNKYNRVKMAGGVRGISKRVYVGCCNIDYEKVEKATKEAILTELNK